MDCSHYPLLFLEEEGRDWAQKDDFPYGFFTYTPSAPECLDTIGFQIGFIFRKDASIVWWIAAIIVFYFCKEKKLIQHI